MVVRSVQTFRNRDDPRFEDPDYILWEDLKEVIKVYNREFRTNLSLRPYEDVEDDRRMLYIPLASVSSLPSTNDFTTLVEEMLKTRADLSFVRHSDSPELVATLRLAKRRRERRRSRWPLFLSASAVLVLSLAAYAYFSSAHSESEEWSDTQEPRRNPRMEA